MKNIAILSICRTPVGEYGGGLSSLSAVQLGEIVVREALQRAKVNADQVDELLFGCVLQAGLGQNVARQISMAAGIPETVPASTLNNLCGSGLKSLNVAAAMIEAGDADIMVVGGTESMSNAPYLLEKARFGYRMADGTLVDEMIRDGLSCGMLDIHMGITAENVAEKYNVTREEQDEYAYQSQMKHKAAQEAGHFKDEIVPVHVKQRKKEFDVTEDEFAKPDTSLEVLAKLRPAFKRDGTGTVTAGNASGVNDGAAAMVICSMEKAEELGLKPLAILRETVSVGLDPAVMGMGPLYALKKLSEKSGISLDDIELFEINEAFASQCVAILRELKLDPEKVNVNGGSIAIGHPIGASGARVLATLIYEMQKRGNKLGVSTLCIGGGMGVASLIERVE